MGEGRWNKIEKCWLYKVHRGAVYLLLYFCDCLKFYIILRNALRETKYSIFVKYQVENWSWKWKVVGWFYSRKFNWTKDFNWKDAFRGWGDIVQWYSMCLACTRFWVQSPVPPLRREKFKILRKNKRCSEVNGRD